ncbi:MAG TPA: outer membrane protein assembly factor BamA [Deltaproteobacteria bacterium]|nr:MAG: outer membrane protein assembly factor BamA [Deltaproteobacteria bacterium GWA2_45_12]HBF13906.1 outer membrane protein assembly factor BamA [Deltaproteobacteria bacterium]
MEKFRKYSSILLFFFVFQFFAPFSFSAEKIVNIDFAGLLVTSETVTRGLLQSIEGSLYSPGAIEKDLKALYKSGLFEDVYVDRQSVAGGVKLVFHVKEKATVGLITFKGNKKIKDKDIEEAMTVRRSGFLEEKKIAESKAAIRKLYEEKGYYAVDIRTEIVPYNTETNELEIIFTIKENRAVYIKRISFVGNHYFSDKKLASHMKTKVKGMLSFLSSSGKIKDEKMRLDIELLQQFYMTNGFIKAKIKDPHVSMSKDKQSIYVTIPVYEGPRYKVASVDVEGDILTSKQELLEKIKLKTGEYYNGMLAHQDQELFTRIMQDQAYFYANVYPSITTDDEAKTANVVYVIQKGRKVSVEKIDIEGNTITRNKVIRREIQVVEGAPYNQTAIELSKRRLAQLGFFETVDFAFPRGSSDDKINIVVTVKEKPTGSVSVGAGFSSLESFVFNGSIQKNNFFGLGISGGASANVSKLRQEFSFKASDRYFMDTKWIVSMNISRYASALNSDFDEQSFGGSLTIGRELIPFLDVSLGYNIQDVSINNFSSQVPAFFRSTASGLTSSGLSSISLDKRDNRVTTTKGTFNSLSSEYAGHGLGGDNDFWRMYADSRLFYPVLKKTVLKVRGVFAYINSLSDDSIPLFERFFLGGINTLRGFDLNSIGPELRIPSSVAGGDGKFTYGGNRMIFFNTEYEVPIYDPAGFRGVLFVDGGQAYGETESVDLSRLRYNYGFGLRWNSPFGPLRFEWGFPIARRNGESFSVFNFSIGQSF